MKVRSFLIPAAAAAVGVGIGAAGATGDTPTAAPEVVTETVTETVEVPVVPQACVDALGESDYLITKSGEFADVVADMTDVMAVAVEAAFYRDTAGMDAATGDLAGINARMTGITTSIQGNSYPVLRDECLAAEGGAI